MVHLHLSITFSLSLSLSLSLIKLFIANLGTKDLTYIGTYLPITYYKPSLTVAPVKLAVI